VKNKLFRQTVLGFKFSMLIIIMVTITITIKITITIAIAIMTMTIIKKCILFRTNGNKCSNKHN